MVWIYCVDQGRHLPGSGVDAYGAPGGDTYPFPGNACRSSSTSTRWFSE
ncbi:hypothetical protein BW38_01105 [Stenotrophomonas sp. RIT309]|nr:hypothetical protein BW38_01105 [Stenotrophomonas sp. RIT309]